MLFYTPTTYPGQGTAQEGRPGLVGALTWAPRACPMAAVGCSAAALEANFYVVCVAYAVLRLWGIVLLVFTLIPTNRSRWLRSGDVW